MVDEDNKELLRTKTLLGTKGIATRSKDAISLIRTKPLGLLEASTCGAAL